MLQTGMLREEPPGMASKNPCVSSIHPHHDDTPATTSGKFSTVSG